MYRLVITELANKDLDDIVRYITEELKNPIAAGHFLDAVDESYRYLKTNPLMYAKCTDMRLEQAGYRKALIKNYLLIYKVDEQAKTVHVLRFFYAARDYERLI